MVFGHRSPMLDQELVYIMCIQQFSILGPCAEAAKIQIPETFFSVSSSVAHGDITHKLGLVIERWEECLEPSNLFHLGLHCFLVNKKKKDTKTRKGGHMASVL